MRPGTGGVDDIAPDDERRSLPRFSAENIAANLSLVDDVRTIAEGRGATSAQIAPAWPPGAPSPSREPNGALLTENAEAAEIVLTADELACPERAVTTIRQRRALHGATAGIHEPLNGGAARARTLRRERLPAGSDEFETAVDGQVLAREGCALPIGRAPSEGPELRLLPHRGEERHRQHRTGGPSPRR
ncbi:aldo-keto reductase family protein [Streptomyces wuyuanensis]|uniref:hypothetical protein n=1 Tax=Streptomyces wuyuanensis TaxID=1196353 RepID=UPI0036AA6EC3